MVACTTREAFAEIRQAADARLLRSDNAPVIAPIPPGIEYAASDEHTIYEAGGFLFFLTYGRGRWLPLRIKERQWLTNLRAKIVASPHSRSGNAELLSAPRS